MKKEVMVTPEQMTAAIHKAVSGERMKPLVKKAPVLSLAFTVFGAELINILFKEENNE